jgi:transcriptional regulator of acetoin/glycerol metabolism
VGPADVLALPGNLAELRHTVVLLARCAKGGIVELDNLPEELRTPRRALGMLESAEREAVADALRAAGGNRSRTAQALGIGRNTRELHLTTRLRFT